MMRLIITWLFMIPFIGMTQTDVLILQKNGRNVKTYAPGMDIQIHTIYDQWLDGTITDMKNDSVYVNYNPFHIHEIDEMRESFSKLHLQTAGTVFIIAGVGVVALNVINGIYRNESASQWMSTSGWITAGAFILGGFLLKGAKYKNYPIGKKYTLHYLNLRVSQRRGG